jgi:eukaryotic-like serine/threonine-protein kinase
MPEAARRLESDVVLDARYVVYAEVAAGGTASVHYGQLRGPHGFSRPVAIKRLHPHIAKDPDFIAMFIDEARLSARLNHANIIHTLDVIQTPGELALVMEYVHGESLYRLLRLAREQGKPIPVMVASSLIAAVLHGLHAAHEARGEHGEPLQIVHRDVSPQNILVGSDGTPRVLDFGIAKALVRMRSTPSGEIKGKLAYIAPEQLHAAHVDRRTDVYGAAAVLWEALTGSQLFDGPSELAVVHRVLNEPVEAPSQHRKDVPSALDAIVLRGLARDIKQRFATALAMALELERSVGVAKQQEIATWLQQLAGPALRERKQRLSQLEQAAPPLAAAHDEALTRRLPPAPKSVTLDTEAAAVDLVQLGVRRSRRQRWLAFAAVVVLCAAVLGALTGIHDVDAVPRVMAAREPEPPSAPRELVLPDPEAVAEPESASATEAPAPSEQPATRPVRAPSARAEGYAPPRTLRRNVARPVATVTRERAQPAAISCAPFYYDAHGIRHPQPECMQQARR